MVNGGDTCMSPNPYVTTKRMLTELRSRRVSTHKGYLRNGWLVRTGDPYRSRSTSETVHLWSRGRPGITPLRHLNVSTKNRHRSTHILRGWPERSWRTTVYSDRKRSERVDGCTQWVNILRRYGENHEDVLKFVGHRESKVSRETVLVVESKEGPLPRSLQTDRSKFEMRRGEIRDESGNLETGFPYFLLSLTKRKPQ